MLGNDEDNGEWLLRQQILHKLQQTIQDGSVMKTFSRDYSAGKKHEALGTSTAVSFQTEYGMT